MSLTIEDELILIECKKERRRMRERFRELNDKLSSRQRVHNLEHNMLKRQLRELSDENLARKFEVPPFAVRKL